jgi:hypothetical protein
MSSLVLMNEFARIDPFSFEGIDPSSYNTQTRPHRADALSSCCSAFSTASSAWSTAFSARFSRFCAPCVANRHPSCQGDQTRTCTRYSVGSQ